MIATTDGEIKRVTGKPDDKRISGDIGQKILHAVASIEYGSVEVLIHDGKVVQIECRKKIRVGRDESIHKGASRQIR